MRSQLYKNTYDYCIFYVNELDGRAKSILPGETAAVVHNLYRSPIFFRKEVVEIEKENKN